MEALTLYRGGTGSDTFLLPSFRDEEGTDNIVDFDLSDDVIGLSDGISFDDLTLSGNSILLEELTLANLEGIEVSELTAANFVSDV